MKGKLLDVQVMRFIAAFLVVVSHLVKELDGGVYQLHNAFTIKLIGQFGVDLFFIISGFIMMYVSRNTNSGISASLEFLIKRICRIVPIYWFFTLLTLFISFVIPEVKNNNSVDIYYLLSSLAFIPYERLDGNITPLLGLGWTLNYEMFFYLIFALVLICRKTWFTILFSSVLLFLVMLGFVVDFNSVVLSYWTKSILIEFLFGFLLAKLYISDFRISGVISWILIALGCITLYLSTTIEIVPSDLQFRGFLWGIPAALIFAGVVLNKSGFFCFLPESIYNLLTRLGDGSFSLYLGHMFVIRGLTLLLPLVVTTDYYNLIYIILAIIISFSLSDLMYRYFEVPSNRFALKLFKK